MTKPIADFGIDVLLDKNSNKWYVSMAGEVGLDPVSVFKKHRGGGWTAVAGLVFGLANPNQLSGGGVTAFWPASVLHLMPGIGGRSNIWGAMTQFAKNIKHHKGATVGFGKSFSGPGVLYFGTSYRMFSSVIDYNSEFVPIDQLSGNLLSYIGEFTSIVGSLASLGNDMSTFSANADAALSLVNN